MELSKQVCSLELSKQLKENGYPQEGLWRWSNYHYCWDDHIEGWYQWRGTKYPCIREKASEVCDEPPKDYFEIVAPTVAELGERFDFTFHQYKAKRNKYVCLCGDAREEANTEADCRAKMWLYLKKQGVL